MFDIGGPELLVILLGIIILFGPKKIPEVAQMIGKGIQKVRSAQSQFKEQIDEIQSELSVVTSTNNFNPEIKEVAASDLNEEHFSESTSSNQNVSHNLVENTKIPESTEHGFIPVYPNKIKEPFNPDSERDNDDASKNNLTESSDKLQG